MKSPDDQTRLEGFDRLFQPGSRLNVEPLSSGNFPTMKYIMPAGAARSYGRFSMVPQTGLHFVVPNGNEVVDLGEVLTIEEETPCEGWIVCTNKGRFLVSTLFRSAEERQTYQCLNLPAKTEFEFVGSDGICEGHGLLTRDDIISINDSEEIGGMSVDSIKAGLQDGGLALIPVVGTRFVYSGGCTDVITSIVDGDYAGLFVLATQGGGKYVLKTFPSDEVSPGQ